MFCLNVLTLILRAWPNVMHFVRTFSIINACLKRKAYCHQRGSKLWKKCNLYIKSIFKNGWWEDAYSSSYLPVCAFVH